MFVNIFANIDFCCCKPPSDRLLGPSTNHDIHWKVYSQLCHVGRENCGMLLVHQISSQALITLLIFWINQCTGLLITTSSTEFRYNSLKEIGSLFMGQLIVIFMSQLCRAIQISIKAPQTQLTPGPAIGMCLKTPEGGCLYHDISRT